VTKSYERLKARNEELQKSLEESQELLRAIRNGEADALVTSGPEGDQVFTLKGSDRAYRTLIEAMSEGAVTLAQDGTILYCNHRFSEMTKSPLEKVVGSSIYHFIPPEDEAAFKRLLRDLGRGELSFRAVDESLLPIFITISALPLGELQEAYSAVFTDLTLQKRSEDMIASERLARSIIEQATEAIVVCDDAGRIIRASDVAAMVCGFNLVQQSFEEVFDLRLTNGEPLSPVSIALKGEVLLKSEVSLHCSNGKQFQLLLNAGPLKSAGGNIMGCVVTFTDITGRKLA
jgi:PAS domain S-box-containing protein